MIEAAFAKVKAAEGANARRAAQQKLGVLLTGHSIAEEGVIYPALSHAGKMGHANTAYTQRVAAKIQMAALEHLDPLSEDYLDKLGHIEGAVATHVYEEESDWFIDLKENAPAEDQQMATERYEEEYLRYVGEDDDGGRSVRTALFRGGRAARLGLAFDIALIATAVRAQSVLVALECQQDHQDDQGSRASS